jgi:two-component system cell cycle sensor histidine kinase/response regulator CckA
MNELLPLRDVDRLGDQLALFQALRLASPSVAIVWNRVTLGVDWVDGPIHESLGFSPDELIKGGWRWMTARMHPSDQVIFEKRLTSVEPPKPGEEEVREWDLRLRHRNGGWRWFRTRSVHYSSSGQDRVLFLFADITSSRRAEDALTQSEERFRALMEHSSDLISILDAQGNLRYNSPAGERLLGYSKKEFIGRNIFSLIHPEDQSRARAVFRRLLEQPGQPQMLVCRYQTKNGRWIWMESLGINKVHHPDIRGFIVNSRDVTDRKMAEEALLYSESQLADSQERYRELVELLPEAVFETDDRGRFRFLNPCGLQTFGYAAEDLDAGLRIHDLFELDAQRVLDELLANSQFLGSTVDVREFNAIRKDGATVPVSLHVVSVIRLGTCAGLRGILIDISERRRTEEEWGRLQERFRQSEKMEAVGQLAGGVAHDFNNHLSAIQGFAEILHEKLENPSLGRYLDRILSSCRRSAELTHQLLTFSGHVRPMEVPLDLDESIGEVVQLIERSFDKRVVIQHERADEACVVLGDPDQLQNAFLNLAFNARDAMPRGGILRFSTRVVSLDEDFVQNLSIPVDPGVFVDVTVSDTGVGMGPDVLAHLFESFFTTKLRGEGTGLGLVSLYSIVKGLGGAIQVSSEVGSGTQFHLYFPRSEMSVPVESAPPPVIPSFPVGKRLMVVEDEALVGEVLLEMLARLGHCGELFCDGRLALNRLTTEGPVYDAVILDLMMPNMNGLDAFREMRRVCPDLPVIVSTGQSLDGDARRIMDEGAVGFLQKPFQLSELAAMVKEVLSRTGQK